MTSGHSKGGEFERKVATRLSKWVTEGCHDRVLWRTPGSGGMAHRLAKEQARWIGGDIGVLDRDCQPACELVSLAHIELKHYKMLDWGRMLCSERKGFLWETWDKTRALADETSRMPLVIVKQNHQPEMVLAPFRFWEEQGISGVVFHREVGVSLFQKLLGLVPSSAFHTIRRLGYGPQTPPPRISRIEGRRPTPD